MEEPNPYESPGVRIATSESPSEAIGLQDPADREPKPREPLGVIAFILAILLLPTLVDLLAVAGMAGRFLPVVALNIGGSAVVLITALRSWRRHLLEPRRWRGFGYLMGATIILGLHALLALSGVLAYVFG
jgi:hypothetical protein